MSRLIARSGWRHLARHPWQFLLAVLGVALGVGVVVSIELANASARQAFELSTETVLGRATHRITAPPGGLDERVFKGVVEAVRPGHAAPVVERYVRTAGDSPLTLRLLGVDPFSEAPFRPYLRRVRGSTDGGGAQDPGLGRAAQTTADSDGSRTSSAIGAGAGNTESGAIDEARTGETGPGHDPSGESGSGRARDEASAAVRGASDADVATSDDDAARVGGFNELLLRFDAVAAPRALAARLGLRVGDRFALDDRGRRIDVTLVALFEPEDELTRRASEDLLVADIAAAQEMLGFTGRLTRIDLRLARGDAGAGRGTLAVLRDEAFADNERGARAEGARDEAFADDEQYVRSEGARDAAFANDERDARAKGAAEPPSGSEAADPPPGFQGAVENPGGHDASGPKQPSSALPDGQARGASTRNEARDTSARLNARGASESEILARVRALLPPGASIEAAGAQRERATQMTRAFRLNLTALSLLALVVGMFLIYNTITFSVVQRREAIGTLRALGATRAQILRDVLGEAAVIGVLGTLLGLGAGILLGRQLVGLVSRTINDLYFVVSIRDVTLAPSSLIVGAALGLAATLLAALPPALEATSAPPRTVQTRSAVETSARRRVPYALAGGTALLALAALLLWLPTTSLATGFGGLFALILACGVLAPVGALALSGLLSRPAGQAFGIVGTLAARGVRASLSRTAIAIAALTVAVSVTVGVGVMIKSFRETVVRWLELSLSADVYISPPTIVSNRNDGTLDTELVSRIRALPGIDHSRTVRSVDVKSDLGVLRLVTIDPGDGPLDSFSFASGDPDEITERFREPDAVLVSEPLAFRRGLARGDPLAIRTDKGERRYTIAGVFYDYASDVGIAMMHRDVYDTVFTDRAIGGLALFLEEGADGETIVERINELAAGTQAVNARSNRALRDASMAVFDRTFTITAVLRLLATIVAFIGVLSALMALQLERARELGVLRANGMTPRQVWGLVTCQTGLMGLIAGLMSIPVGMLLAWVMIFVINKRSFGWSIEMLVSPAVLGQALAIALVAALLAGIYPSWKMSRTSPAAALRNE